MAYTTNINDFQTFRGSALVESYLILIAIELALKDRGATAPDGHDIPELLSALLQFPDIAKHSKFCDELGPFIQQLRTDLQLIWCTDADGIAKKIPTKSYPHLRYCRCFSEWDGLHETKGGDILSLNATCKNLRDFLRRNKRITKVNV